MTAQLVDGRQIAKKLRKTLRAEIDAFYTQTGIQPTLALLRIGNDPASVSYAQTIERTFQKANLGFVPYLLPETASLADALSSLREINETPTLHGIMIQEPLPQGIDRATLIEALNPAKDVDGVHPINAGRLAQAAPSGRSHHEPPFFIPATPAGGLELLKQAQIDLAGRHAVVVGRSNIVGKPMALLLLREHATVTLCHSRTHNLADLCRQADILCAAVGKANLIQGDWIKPGATVIDFGVNFDEQGHMCGDVDFESASQVAGAITPVPGGTGPMTNLMLMRNLLTAAQQQC